MRLQAIFERKAVSASKSSTLVEEESSDTTATVYHVEDMMARANVGIKRAGHGGVRIKSVDLSMKKRGIKATAMGLSSHSESIEKRADEGWKRAMNISGNTIREISKAQPRHRSNLKSVAIGISHKEKNDENTLEQQMDQRGEEALRRVRLMKDQMGTEFEMQASSSKPKVRQNILSASMGITSLKDPMSDSNSDDSLYAEEMKSKMEEGMYRVKNLKPVRGYETNRPQKQRSNILAASMGINTMHSSDESIQEEYERKMEEGYKRAMDPKTRAESGDGVTESSSKNVKTRTSILAAAMGVTHIDDPNDALMADQERMDEADEKAEEGLRRLEQIRKAPVNFRAPKKPASVETSHKKHKRGKILTAAMNK